MAYLGRSSGRRTGVLSTLAVIAILMGSAASSQALRDAQGPAEFPPSSFTGNQYVDSRGCVFVRAGIGGLTEWVPRVSRNRQQLCGFEPTQVAGATSTAPRVDVPNPLDTPVAGLPDRDDVQPEPVVTAAAPAPAPQPAPAPVVTQVAPVAAPAPAARTGLPTSTANAINPLTGQPVGAPTVTAAAPSPRVITAPAPVAQPRVLTRAQACQGLTGVQPNLISQRTGQPIDCGGAPAAQIAQVQAPVAAPVAAPQQRRMTRAQACADMAATGRRYISASTGLPINCGTSPSGGMFGRLQADLRLPQQPYSNPLDGAPGALVTQSVRPQIASASPIPYSNPLDGAPGTTGFVPGVNTQVASTCAGYAVAGVSGLPVRCGPQAQSPSGSIDTGIVSRARTSPSGGNVLEALGVQSPPPYSNPQVAYRLTTAPTPPAGYTNVWEDGRLNPNRGIRTGPQVQSPWGGPASNTVRYATQQTQTDQPVAQPRVSTRTAPQAMQQTQQRAEQLSGHRYVQVGTFSSRDQAQAVAQSLRNQGLPMRIGVYQRGGQELRIVLAGPFGSDRQLQNALGTARGAGFSGAFTRQ